KKLGTLTNSYNLKRQQLETQADSIEVLVLGSSESLHGINPSYFSFKGYNAANMAQSLFYDENILVNHINKMPRLKYVVIAVSYFSLGYQIIDTREKWRDYFYAQCWGIKYPEIKSSDPFTYSKILLYTPKMSLVYAAMLFRVNIAKDYSSNGWANMTYPSEINDQNARITVERHNAAFNPKRFEGVKKELDTILSVLKKRNITPILYTPPVTSSYYKFTDKGKLDTIQITLSELCAKYECTYYNYFTDKQFTNSDFGDCDHLNSKGAEKLSKLINDDILLEAKKQQGLVLNKRN
ncbi:MAG TPA: D-alanyl-lipoteichoic acid biosynthesis protein DltD, partial [Bacteroidia bacterium]|nr:D-alanyl-lipoteichoic acid biosynthesis protein DltD [Bacteroidia bacterium]